MRQVLIKKETIRKTNNTVNFFFLVFLIFFNIVVVFVIPNTV